MKNTFTFLGVIVLGLLLSALVAWGNRTHIVSNFLAKQLHIPVKIRSLKLGMDQSQFIRLWAGNPTQSKTQTSFSADQVEIDLSLKKILTDPLIIDLIEMDNIVVGIEFYNLDGSNNNWSHILTKSKKKQSQKARNFLIKSLVLKNITVQITQADGSVKRFEPIERIEFANISNQEGLPLSDIEKLLFRLMMQDVFKRVNLNQLLQTISPFEYVPGGVPLPFFPGFF
ncbi:MAG: hypothetical protein JSS32_07725 [Verrucomicrobia bacterium]|nr:hypothetical protein [Verrucomicrobiota bacterium]